MQVVSMQRTDTDDVVRLIAEAMNEDEARWARRTIDYHFDCRDAGLDDGRYYLVWRQKDTISGIIGLHHYIWGPPENVWLAWFAIAPALQRRGWGRKLLDRIEHHARKLGFTKMFIETYDHPDFDDARSFYAARGYRKKGAISEFLSDGSSMVVFGKKL
ncbi:MAG: GNAT family N-acetyltransferase [Chitinivibrionales bacterium]